MTSGLEREIKLHFASPEEARSAIIATGATLRCARRLQDDALYDSAGGTLRAARSTLRLRTEAGQSRLTFKGPPQASSMKLREELETVVEDGEVIRELLSRLGFTVWFRYQKYREEFDGEDVVVAIDETPIGTWVEIEGAEAGINRTAASLGRGSADYIVASYYGLFVQDRTNRGGHGEHMVFER